MLKFDVHLNLMYNVSHYISVNESPLLAKRTFKYYQAVAGHAWIVSVKWCIDCIERNRVLPEVRTARVHPAVYDCISTFFWP